MKDMKFNYALAFAVVLQAVALIWYVSKLDSKVETLYKFYEEESQKSVVENQVKMKLDLEYVMSELKSIKKDIKQSKNKSKEIMQQHDQIFELLKDKQEVPSGYSYGN